MIELALRFPCCKRKFKLDGGSSAIFIVKRRCPVCRARWQVKIEPLKSKREGVHLHRLEWLCLEGGEPQRARYCGGAPEKGQKVRG